MTTTTHYGPHPAGHGDTEHKGPLEECTAPDCVEQANAERARQSGIRALTVKQPFAFAIAEGFKPIENRTRRTNHRGEIYLHTSKAPQRGVHIVRYSRDAAIRLDELGGSGNFWNALHAVPSRFYTPAPTLAWRAVIATARITGCHRAGDGCTPACAAWGEPDRWHWEIADARPLTTPIGINGNLGLWIPPWGLIEAVRAQIDTTTAQS
ncbi:hypothetical protein [Actinacidiphila acididurans]|uniref:ASCH domain-containing protein n=1 Tax=Actinacidiphila acididurans TaxID=2784346 RepID=A0ABS2U2W5_9ACTN|nr:hypothetical protein [Actinacidiphila acididurans]MBM9509935.1 hypothetical protein [Actinacidiphila acididurans]